MAAAVVAAEKAAAVALLAVIALTQASILLQAQHTLSLWVPEAQGPRDQPPVLTVRILYLVLLHLLVAVVAVLPRAVQVTVVLVVALAISARQVVVTPRPLRQHKVTTAEPPLAPHTAVVAVAVLAGLVVTLVAVLVAMEAQVQRQVLQDRQLHAPGVPAVAALVQTVLEDRAVVKPQVAVLLVTLIQVQVALAAEVTLAEQEQVALVVLVL